jgi:hypothetical protein
MKSLKASGLGNHVEPATNYQQGGTAVFTRTNLFICWRKFILALSRLEFIMNSLFRAFSILLPHHQPERDH